MNNGECRGSNLYLKVVDMFTVR